MRCDAWGHLLYDLLTHLLTCLLTHLPTNDACWWLLLPPPHPHPCYLTPPTTTTTAATTTPAQSLPYEAPLTPPIRSPVDLPSALTHPFASSFHEETVRGGVGAAFAAPSPQSAGASNSNAVKAKVTQGMRDVAFR